MMGAGLRMGAGLNETLLLILGLFLGDVWIGIIDNLAGLNMLLLVILGEITDELIDGLGELITLGELILLKAKESLAGRIRFV